MSEIKIIIGNVKIEATQNDLAEVSETADGVSFLFKGGLQVLYSNPYMPSTNKQIIKNTIDNVKGKKLIIQPSNNRTPALIDAT